MFYNKKNHLKEVVFFIIAATFVGYSG